MATMTKTTRTVADMKREYEALDAEYKTRFKGARTGTPEQTRAGHMAAAEMRLKGAALEVEIARVSVEGMRRNVEQLRAAVEPTPELEQAEAEYLAAKERYEALAAPQREARAQIRWAEGDLKAAERSLREAEYRQKQRAAAIETLAEKQEEARQRDVIRERMRQEEAARLAAR